MPKGEGNHSMAANQWSCPGVWSDALGDPRGTVKAELPEPQSPEGATARPPEKRLKPVPHSAVVSSADQRSLRDAERYPARVFKEMNVEPKPRYDV
jgi:hypothetical protein